MTKIVLFSVNARYTHPSMGLRCLRANMGALRDDTVIREFHLKQDAGEIAYAVAAENPVLVGVGLYIWNVEKVTETLRRIREMRPDTVIVAGGPEAGHEYENTPWFKDTDYVVVGEGESAFPELAVAVLAGKRPARKVVAATAVIPPESLALPYGEYSEQDCATKIIYVETSRGCPFRCAFCLSALEPRVREFPLDPIFDALSDLIARGARRFKFVDRTFNLRSERVHHMLDFLRLRIRDNMQIHFEIVPDRLDADFVAALADFPPGAIRLEAGIQSVNPETLAAIDRPQDSDLALRNLRALRERTGAVIHADLVAGLPYETRETFANAFDRVLAVQPHEIQVGILKRLRGAPINRLIEPCRLVFAEQPPYEILETHRLGRTEIECIKRFARYFEIYHNTGHFPQSLPLLWQTNASPFEAFMAFSNSLFQATGRTHAIPLSEQAGRLHAFLRNHGVQNAREVIEADYYSVPGRRESIAFD